MHRIKKSELDVQIRRERLVTYQKRTADIHIDIGKSVPLFLNWSMFHENSTVVKLIKLLSQHIKPTPQYNTSVSWEERAAINTSLKNANSRYCFSRGHTDLSNEFP